VPPESVAGSRRNSSITPDKGAAVPVGIRGNVPKTVLGGRRVYRRGSGLTFLDIRWTVPEVVRCSWTIVVVRFAWQ